jgi:pimeloyl-ACP methyl ester carboxylesterase
MNMDSHALPVTRYARSGDVSIAYQVMGNGPVDLIIVPGIVSHVEFLHEFPGYTAFLRRLSTFARVITFDKRGQGLSDRMTGAPSLETRMDDVRAVMDSVSSERAAFMGFSEGCAMSLLYAATYPQRVSHLVLFGGYSVPRMWLDDFERPQCQVKPRTLKPSRWWQSLNGCQPVRVRSGRTRL